jgi:hypothetical protein
MYISSRRRGIADLLFRPQLDLSQVGWLVDGQLNWLSNVPGMTMTLHLGYEDFDDWQDVTIDVAPGTSGLIIDGGNGLVVSGGLALVWRGWLGKFSFPPPILTTLLTY